MPKCANCGENWPAAELDSEKLCPDCQEEASGQAEEDDTDSEDA